MWLADDSMFVNQKDSNPKSGPAILQWKKSGGFGMIQTGSNKSSLIPTAHVLQTFDTLRNKLPNVERYSVIICFLIKETALKTIEMSVSDVKFI